MFVGDGIDAKTNGFGDLSEVCSREENFFYDIRELFVREVAGVDAAVVIYNRQGMFSAARGWFMFAAMGFDNIAVLDGGLPAWLDAGFNELHLDMGPFTPGSFTAKYRELFVDALTTKALAQQEGARVIDARSAERFTGLAPEPRPGLRAGHIPGSVNLPFTSLLDEQGRFRAPEEIQQAVDAVADGAQTLIFSPCLRFSMGWVK